MGFDFMLRGLALAAATFAAGNADASTIFFDDFEEAYEWFATASYPGRGGDFTAWNNFTVVEGSVDAISVLTYDICPSRGCMDLDGSWTRNAGTVVQTSPVLYQPGFAYTLSFNSSGNRRIQRPDSMVVQILDGVLSPKTIDKAWNEQAEVTSVTFSVDEERYGSLVFNHAGGDSYGIVLDWVKIESVPGAAPLDPWGAAVNPVPLPSGLALTATALAGLGFVARSRCRRNAELDEAKPTE